MNLGLSGALCNSTIATKHVLKLSLFSDALHILMSYLWTSTFSWLFSNAYLSPMSADFTAELWPVLRPQRGSIIYIEVFSTGIPALSQIASVRNINTFLYKFICSTACVHVQ